MKIRCPFCKHKIEFPRFAEAHIAVVWELFERYKWNRTHTAAAMGIPVRTLRNWISKWEAMGIAIPDSPESISERRKRANEKAREKGQS
jgi:hypothetical protein